MVVIEIKKSDTDSFLYETTCNTTNDELVRDIVEVNNLRVRLQQLCGGIRELSMYGPMKAPDKAGLDEYASDPINKTEYYLPDPTGVRNGSGTGPQLAEVIDRVATDAEQALHKVS